MPIDVKFCMATSCENYLSPLLVCTLFSPQCVPFEVDLLTKIPEHTNIIKVYDFGNYKGYTVIVMERPEPAKDLFDFLDLYKPPPRVKMEVLKTIFRQVLTAVRHCHSSSVFHGDLSLENVLVEFGQEHGTLKTRAILIDFGWALTLEADQYCCIETGKLHVMETIWLASATPQLDQNAWQRVATYKSGSKQTYRRIFSAYKTTLTNRIKEKCPTSPASTLSSFSHDSLGSYWAMLAF